MLNTLGVFRRLRWFLPALLLAVAIIAYTIAVPTNWFRSAEVTGTIVPVPPNTWIVDDDGPAHFRKIQEAINKANPGDTVFVKAGTYYENVVVNKTVLLRGESSSLTIIDGRKLDAGVYVTADYVTITEFTLQNSSAYPPRGGIYLYGSSGTTIQNNNLVTNYWGIYLSSSLNNTISNNKIINNYGGINLYSSNDSLISHNKITNNSGGVSLHSSFNTTMSNNIIANNRLGLNLYRSSANSINKNDITNNEDGIFQYSSTNTIINNNITNNDRYGIYLSSCLGNSIYHNNFIDNDVQGDTTDSYDNIWDDGYPSGGNYWSDYAGVDVKSGSGQDLPGSDGVGDTPYIVDANNQDRYPLMKPWSPRVRSVITISTELETVTIGSNITISGKITPVRANVNVTIYQRLVGEGTWNTLVTLKTNSTGSYIYVWKPAQITTYELKAIWLGDEGTLPAESDITIVNVEPIHDIAIVSVEPSPKEVYVGWVVNITVIVRNEGNVTETFTATCKYELEDIEHLIGSAAVNNLAPNANTTLTFTWTTTDITVHTIKIEIPALIGETDTSDNTMTSPIAVKVKITGDVNGDNKIDIRDIAQAALSFGTYPDHPRYNIQADINQDNKVDIRDLALIAVNFGRTYP